MKTVSDELAEQVLALIDSAYLRDYLTAHKDTLDLDDYCDIVAGAPVSLRQKLSLLEQLAAMPANTRAVLYRDMVAAAIRRLEQSRAEENVLVISAYSFDFESTPPKCERGVVFPVVGYEAAREMIRQENLFEMESPDDTPSLWYWKMELYDILPDGTTELCYTYICNTHGEPQYYRHDAARKDRRSADRFERADPFYRPIPGWNCPVPYQVGDILYVDCRPYTLPAYCVVTEVTSLSDCCGVQCAFPGKDGSIESGAFKHGHYFADSLEVNQFLSPLYRAVKYEGALPEGYEWMKQVKKEGTI